jgi:hypothetical protein
MTAGPLLSAHWIIWCYPAAAAMTETIGAARLLATLASAEMDRICSDNLW